MTVVAPALVGCGRCASPLEDGDLRCSVCALPVEKQRGRVEKVHVQILRCTECGAAISFDANKQAPACAFCRAVLRVEEPVDPVEEARLRLPFTVDRERATIALRSWLSRRGYFAPATLRDEAVLDSLTPLCWAAWIVNAEALVTWAADSDAGARRSKWAPHAGQTQLTFGNICVPASRGLRTHECAQLVPHYDLSNVVAVSDHDDTGVRIESFDAQRSAARLHVHRAIEELAKQRIQQRDIPGSRFRKVRVSCLIERQTTDRVALPAWVLVYRFRGSPYRAVVHGRRAEVVIGSAPLDWAKIARLAGAIFVAIMAIVIAVLVLTR